MRSKFLPFTLLLTLAACDTPTLLKPTAYDVPQWKEAPVEVAASATEIDHMWWKRFNDPMLDALIDKARSNSPDLKIALARINQARSEEEGTLADQLPNFSTKTDASRQRFSRTLSNFPFAPKYANNYTANFDASWEVNVLGIEPALKASGQFTARREEDYNQALVTLYGDVARSYFTIRQLQAQIATTEKNVKTQEDVVTLASSLNAAGKDSQVNLAQAKALLATTSASLEPLTRSLKEQYYTLDALTGATPGENSSAMISPQKQEIPNLNMVLASPSTVIAERPDIRAAERELSYRAALKDVAFAQYYPKLSLSGLLGFETGKSGSIFKSTSKVWTLGGGLSLPIFDFGRIRADINQADAIGQEALAAYEKTVLGALSEVESTLAAIATEQRNYQKLTDAVEASQLAVTLAEERYRIGRDAYLNVLTAQQNLYTASNAQAQSRGEILIQQVRLYKSLGSGWKNNTTNVGDENVDKTKK
ncbi:MAG: efflux transporter outer membrane subunit [Rickettsiales bacterium]